MACYHITDPCLGRILPATTQPTLLLWVCNHSSCKFHTMAHNVATIQDHFLIAHKLRTTNSGTEVTAHADFLLPRGFNPTPIDRKEDMWPGELGPLHRLRESSATTNSSGACSDLDGKRGEVLYLWDRKLGWMSEHPAGVRMWHCANDACAFSTLADRVKVIQYHVWREWGLCTTRDLKEATFKGEAWAA